MRYEYDFRIAGRSVGSYVLEDDGFELRQRVDFQVPDGERYRNDHVVRYRQGRPVAYRVVRAFDLLDGYVVRIDWGDALSVLRSPMEE